VDTHRFTGRTAVVTGAGSGIGRATALRAATEGTTATGIEAPMGSDLFPGRMAGFLQNVPYTATAEQVAAVIVFLASDDASNVNGVIMPSDGGWSAV
jgi:NAD(P)-dependent dehydrogenase (short-subunit alcohol dehydrogenase family)